MTDYIKTRKNKSEKFLSGFNGREITGDTISASSVSSPDIIFKKRDKKVMAEVGIPIDTDKHSIMFKTEEDSLSIFYRMLGKKQYHKLNVLPPDGVDFERNTAHFKDGSLILYFK